MDTTAIIQNAITILLSILCLGLFEMALSGIGQAAERKRAKREVTKAVVAGVSAMVISVAGGTSWIPVVVAGYILVSGVCHIMAELDEIRRTLHEKST